MSKPKTELFEELKKLDAKIAELSEKRDTLTKRLVKKFGNSEHIYPVKGEEKPFARLHLIDNQEAFESGEPIFKTTSLSRYVAKITYLQNDPREKEKKKTKKK